MGLEVEKNKKHEPLIIEISDYETMEQVLTEILIPFSELLKTVGPPDIYSGYEKIPFEKRDPLYKSIMREEFAEALRSVCKSE
ncbi:MAG: hypothetical protein ACFE9R_02120 [Candidatus Hermodarchaeota archaeon]